MRHNGRGEPARRNCRPSSDFLEGGKNSWQGRGEDEGLDFPRLSPTHSLYLSAHPSCHSAVKQHTKSVRLLCIAPHAICRAGVRAATSACLTLAGTLLARDADYFAPQLFAVASFPGSRHTPTYLTYPVTVSIQHLPSPQRTHPRLPSSVVSPPQRAEPARLARFANWPAN